MKQHSEHLREYFYKRMNLTTKTYSLIFIRDHPIMEFLSI